jgi:hypothetical protein
MSMTLKLCNIEKEAILDYIIIKRKKSCEITISFLVSDNKKTKQNGRVK